MTSPDPIPPTLSDQLRQLGLVHTATELNDFIARATQKRWSPVVLLETLVRAELDARARQRVERRLKEARVGRFKAMADFEWDWPTQIHRPSVERVLTLEFVTKRENTILVAAQGLGGRSPSPRTGNSTASDVCPRTKSPSTSTGVRH